MTNFSLYKEMIELLQLENMIYYDYILNLFI